MPAPAPCVESGTWATRADARQLHIKPLMDDLELWFKTQRSRISARNHLPITLTEANVEISMDGRGDLPSRRPPNCQGWPTLRHLQ